MLPPPTKVLREDDDDDEESTVSISRSKRATTTTSAAAREARRERKTLARRETVAVRRLRIVVLGVIFVAAILVSVSVYLFTRHVETNEFQRVFESHANRIVESFHEILERELSAIDTLSVTYTSFAQATGAKFPYVRLPHFEVRSANTRIQADALFYNWLPLVRNNERAAWEQYAKETHQEYAQAFERETVLRDFQNDQYGINQSSFDDIPGFENNFFRDRIWDSWWTVPERSPSPDNLTQYFPIWQTSPVTPWLELLNLDVQFYGLTREAIPRLLQTNKAILNEANGLIKRAGRSIVDFYLVAGQYRDNIATFAGTDPISALFYPVFDSFDLETRQLAGLLLSNIYWRIYFQDNLPPSARGILCVMHSGDQVFTYRVDGPDAIYLGPEDLHDPLYDKYSKHTDVLQYMQERQSIQTKGYTAVDLDTDFKVTTLTVYPSATLEASHRSTLPAILTAVAALIFAYTTGVFLLYDYVVERRQTIVMDRAVQNGAIVSALYPESVRERLMQETVGEEDQRPKQLFLSRQAAWLKSIGGSASKGMRDSVTTAATAPVDTSGAASVVDSSRGRPIADFYEHTTIMFADIAGFTSWSAKRAPVEVFELLEALYSVFDAVAARRSVFKVETIGDCYVAVTGLPLPQTDHAVRLVRFARDALLTKGTAILAELEPKFGADTNQLGFRIGLHSGKVTAGVLRGDKSRFQLFGDTMITASRMESTGIKGRIHISQSTADELANAGKAHWVTPRDPKKGGEMQTYWIDDRWPSKSMLTASSLSSVGDALAANEEDAEAGVFQSRSAVVTLSTTKTEKGGNVQYRREVKLPPGPLGVVVEDGSVGDCLVICVVESTSPLHGLAFAGDVIVGFNEIDTSAADATDLYLLSQEAANDQKVIVLESRHPCPGHAASGTCRNDEESAAGAEMMFCSA